MFNCVESRSTKKNISWILSESAEATGILRASFCMKGIMSAINYTGQLFLHLTPNVQWNFYKSNFKGNKKIFEL
jgi:hypothetical protein